MLLGLTLAVLVGGSPAVQGPALDGIWSLAAPGGCQYVYAFAGSTFQQVRHCPSGATVLQAEVRTGSLSVRGDALTLVTTATSCAGEKRAGRVVRFKRLGKRLVLTTPEGSLTLRPAKVAMPAADIVEHGCFLPEGFSAAPIAALPFDPDAYLTDRAKSQGAPRTPAP